MEIRYHLYHIRSSGSKSLFCPLRDLSAIKLTLSVIQVKACSSTFSKCQEFSRNVPSQVFLITCTTNRCQIQCSNFVCTFKYKVLWLMNKRHFKFSSADLQNLVRKTILAFAIGVHVIYELSSDRASCRIITAILLQHKTFQLIFNFIVGLN